MELDTDPTNTCKYPSFMMFHTLLVDVSCNPTPDWWSYQKKGIDPGMEWGAMGWPGWHLFHRFGMWEESLTNLGFVWTPHWTLSWPTTAASVLALPFRFSLVSLHFFKCLSLYQYWAIHELGSWWFFLEPWLKKRAWLVQQGHNAGFALVFRRRCFEDLRHSCVTSCGSLAFIEGLTPTNNLCQYMSVKQNGYTIISPHLPL